MTVEGDPPTMSIDPVSTEVTLTHPAPIYTTTVTLTNAGDGPLDWFVFGTDGSAAADCAEANIVPWLYGTPAAGRLAADGQDQFVLTIDRHNVVGSGTFTGTVCVIGNDPLNSPLETPVTVHTDLLTFGPVFRVSVSQPPD